MDKLIIVEGLPGSGKTTLAKMIYQSLSEFTSNIHIYVEGDLHPADMAWSACITSEEYKKICIQYPDYIKSFEQNKSDWNGYTILAYTKIENLSEHLACYFEQKEFYDGHAGKELFCEIHKSRWKKFGQEASGINIFECALLQNHVNELMLFHCASEEDIYGYIRELADSVSNLKPIIIYLDFDTEVSIKRASDERIDDNGNRVWESRVTEYISSSPYGIKHGLVGISGMYKYFEKRKQLELQILEKLPIEQYIIPVNIDNQHDIAEQLIEKISEVLKD